MSLEAFGAAITAQRGDDVLSGAVVLRARMSLLFFELVARRARGCRPPSALRDVLPPRPITPTDRNDRVVLRRVVVAPAEFVDDVVDVVRVVQIQRDILDEEPTKRSVGGPDAGTATS